MAGLLTAAEDLWADAAGGVLLADGGTGTALQAQGLPAGVCPEAWNLHHPDRVAAVAAAYAAAGSGLVYTNTFGANAIALTGHGLAAEVREINLAAVRAARTGAGPGVKVAGSIGPTGTLLEPLGDLLPEAAAEAFAEQAAALVAAGVDALVLETFTQLNEAEAAVRAVRRVTAGPVIVSLSFDMGGRTVMGVSAEEAAPVLLAAGADVLGANCGGPWRNLTEALAGFERAAPGTALLLKPNAGVPQVTAAGVVYPSDADDMARFLARAVDTHPVRIVGGCCGTGPAHIAALRRVLAARRRAGEPRAAVS